MSKPSSNTAWAHLRFSIVGPLLSSPPPKGELEQTLRALSERSWTHPTSARPVRFAFATIERWYHIARRAPQDPVGALRRAVRSDLGETKAISGELRRQLIAQYRAHPSWTYKLHADNLAVFARREGEADAKSPSYSSVLRFMKAHGLWRKKKARATKRPGQIRAEERLERREVRSYEAEHVGALWHLDFHVSSLPVLTASGQWRKPIVLGILDDRSRLCCHLQCYFSESAEDLVHGLSQAIQKRGLPRAILTDNGAAMCAEEFKEGLLRLGVVHETTLPYSPYQNGKQETFWALFEGRLMAMLERVKALDLDFLNQATIAWVEMEYNRRIHSEIGEKPLDRFLAGPDVLRPSPSSDELRRAFRQEVTRAQRRSDGTVRLEGGRFELPSRYRHLRRVTLRYARWDLSSIDLVDERSGVILSRVYALDRMRNADAVRRALDALPGSETLAADDDSTSDASGGVAPLLQELMADYAATGIPPAYLPRPDPEREEHVSESDRHERKEPGR